MHRSTPGRRAALRALIQQFLQDRLAGKLEKLGPDDPKRDELTAQHAWDAWIGDAARRAENLQLATHILKGIHPDARGTSLYCPPGQLPAHPLAGSHNLPSAAFTTDLASSSAAHLSAYSFLRLRFEEKDLFFWLQAGDPDLLATLSDDPNQARQWCDAFLAIAAQRGEISSHVTAKQVYWLVDEDPLDNGAYHLLTPLYASALAHHVYRRIEDDRFGAESKAARDAKQKNAFHPTGYRVYPNLAVQKLGGTNTQNVSQLNSARRGTNYLLASLPPVWKRERPSLPQRTPDGSAFTLFGRRATVRDITGRLLRFLGGDPPVNRRTRDYLDALVSDLIDEVLAFTAELRACAPGWTAASHCNLALEHCLWLDPGRAQLDADFAGQARLQTWPLRVSQDFARWLNGVLRASKLVVGEKQYLRWARAMQDDMSWQRVLGDERVWLATLESHLTELQDDDAPIAS